MKKLIIIIGFLLPVSAYSANNNVDKIKKEYLRCKQQFAGTELGADSLCFCMAEMKAVESLCEIPEYTKGKTKAEIKGCKTGYELSIGRICVSAYVKYKTEYFNKMFPFQGGNNE